MRRFFCWLFIFILCASLLPMQVLAAEVSLESHVPEESISLAKIEEVKESAVPSATPTEEVHFPSQATVPLAPLPSIVTSSPQVTGPETTPGSIVTTLSVSSTIEYVEMYNQSDAPVDISKLRFRASVNEITCDMLPTETGWLLVGEYMTFRSPVITGSHHLNTDCLFSSDITRLEVFYNENRIQLIDNIAASQWLRHGGAVKTNTKTTLDCAHKASLSQLKQTGSVTDYVQCPGSPDLIEGSLYTPPVQISALKIMEVLPNSRNCVPSDTGMDCSDYVKIKNMSNAPVNLAEFRLRSGAKFSGATITSSFNWHQSTLHPDRDEFLLPAGQYFLLRLRNDGQIMNLPAGDSNVWIEDYYGVKTYDEVAYSNMDLAAAKGKSWAYDIRDSMWKLGRISPQGDNTFPAEEGGRGSVETPSSLKPCRDDQYRSEETHRCRNIASPSSLAACKEGQYRSEETNRCRSIASAAAAVLKPCADDQFRSPITNRCRKIASSDDASLVDCGEGRERNPLTKRCRNVASSKMPAAAFPVEPVKQTGMAFVGWWALGGLGMLAVGYAGWEWRSEIRTALRKATSFFPFRK